jgi:hypothetical protein
VIEAVCAELRTHVGIGVGLSALFRDSPIFWNYLNSAIKGVPPIHLFIRQVCSERNRIHNLVFGCLANLEIGHAYSREGEKCESSKDK